MDSILRIPKISETALNKVHLDDRLTDIFRLIEDAPLEDVNTILDIGAGEGKLAMHLSKKGKKVTCTGVAISSYVADVNYLRDQYEIDYVECDVETMPFADGIFDAVIMCHVLEHCPDVFRALGHARRVLREGGLLIIFVPPQEDIVCAGHISVGWNVGQLMYVLLLNGFDVQNGSFINYRYNVCGFVRRTERRLPQLRFDRGDISVLAKEGFFPLPIGDGDGFADKFNGAIKAINWPNVSRYALSAQSNPIRRIVYILVLIIPAPIRFGIGRILLKLGKLLIKTSCKNIIRLY
jgi:SAM-dependent methyltransferase